MSERKACAGDVVLEVGDMAECAACGRQVRWDLRDDFFWGFQNCPEAPKPSDIDTEQGEDCAVVSPGERG